MYAPLFTNYGWVIRSYADALKQYRSKAELKRFKKLPLALQFIEALAEARKSVSEYEQHARQTRDAKQAREAEMQSDRVDQVGFYGVPELAWKHQDNPSVLFLESKELCERLLHAKIDLASLSSALPPSFALMLPRGVMIDGFELSSAVVAIFTEAQRAELINSYVRKTISSAAWADFDPNTGMEDPDRYHVMYCFHLSNPATGHSGYAHHHAAGDDIFDVVAEINAMPSKDMTINQKVLKLIASLIVYAQAAPEQIKDGIHIKTDNKTATRSKNQFIIAEKKFEQSDRAAPIAPFYRTWHFATLRNKRFYKGEYAGMEPGSRVVFRNAAMVGRTKNKTAVKTPDD